MTKRFISHDDQKPGTGLPDVVETALNATYAQKGEIPDGLVTADDLVGYATWGEVLSETDAAARFATQDQLLQVVSPESVEVTDATVAAAVSAGTSTPAALDGRYGNLATIDLTADTAVNLPPGRVVTVVLRQSAGGGHAAFWPGNVVWDAGVPPTLQTAENAVDVVTFLRTGTVTLGMLSGQFAMPISGPTVSSPSHTDTTILVEWGEVAGAIGYEVRAFGYPSVSRDPAARFHQIGGLAPDTAHTVEVRAILPTGPTGWTGLPVTTLPTPAPLLADDFTAPAGTPINGRITPTGAVALVSPGVNLTLAGNDAALIDDNNIYRSAAGGERLSWPISQRRIRVSVDYTLTLLSGQMGLLALGVGNSGSDGVVASINRGGELKIHQAGGGEAGPPNGFPTSGRFALQVEGKYVTALINGLPVRTKIIDGIASAGHAGIGISAGNVTVDNLEAVYL